MSDMTMISSAELRDEMRQELRATKARVAELEAAIRQLKTEYDSPVADYQLRLQLRKKLFDMVC